MSNAEFNDEQFKRELDEAVAPYRADAERYRWLRDTAFTSDAVRLVKHMPGEMDAAIDAAMDRTRATGET